MISKAIDEKLHPDKIYHIYNRAVGDEVLFRSYECYYYFFDKLIRFILPVSRIYAYCLIPNHFHLLLKIRSTDEIKETRIISNGENVVKKVNQAFSNFFNSYAVSYNRTYKRRGKLFMLPYKRILVDNHDYFISLINYIHRNPLHHGLTDSYDKWPYSSFNDFLGSKKSIVEKEYVLDMFGGVVKFIAFHQCDFDLTGQS